MGSLCVGALGLSDPVGQHLVIGAAAVVVTGRDNSMPAIRHLHGEPETTILHVIDENGRCVLGYGTQLAFLAHLFEFGISPNIDWLAA